jgi:PAS domain-containing protein
MADSTLCRAGDERLFSIGETAALTGVSTDTIRAWERRHRLVSPQRTRARHRRYTEADVRTLREVRERVRGQRVPVGAAMRFPQRDAHGRAPDAPARAPDAVQLGAVANDVWHAALNLIPELVLLLDGTGTIVAVNVAVAKLAGEVRERLAGRRFGDLVEAYDRAKAVSLYRAPLRPHRNWELSLRTPAGAGFYTFDCWPLASHPPLLALIGSEVGARPAAAPRT